MARRMPTLTVPVAANIPDAGITPGEWNPVKDAALLAEQREVDVERFVPAAATRAEAWQMAIDYASANGGNVISSYKGVQPMTKGLDRKGVTLRGFGTDDTVLDFSGMAPSDAVNSAAISNSGSLSPLPGITAPVSAGRYTIEFVSDPGLQPGDDILIYNPADYSFSPYRNYYRNGEYTTVLKMVGNVAHLTRPLYATHPSTVEVYKLHGGTGTVSDMTIIGRPTRYVIRDLFGRNVTYRNLVMSGTDISHLSVEKAYGATIDNVVARDYHVPPDTGGTNYGILIANSQHVTVMVGYVETARHGFAVGGGPDVGPPNRDLKVIGSYTNAINEKYPALGCDLHGNIEYAQFQNVTMASGAAVAGDHIGYFNCQIESRSDGICVYGREPLGAHFEFHGCTIKPRAHHAANAGFFYFHWNSGGNAGGGFSEANASKIRSGESFIISDCTFDLQNYRALSGITSAVRVFTDNSGHLPLGNDFVFLDNTIISTATSFPTTTVLGLYLSGQQPDYGFRRVIIRDPNSDWGILVSNTGASTIQMDGGSVTESPWRGFEIQEGAASPATHRVFTVRNINVVGANSFCGNFVGEKSKTTLILENVALLNGNQGSLNTQNLRIDEFKEVVKRNVTVGDTKPSPTIWGIENITDVTTLTDHDTVVVGAAGSNPHYATITNHRYRGAGVAAPEGNVTAGPGSIYTSYGTGLTYRKASGTGNTGWVALADVP